MRRIIAFVVCLALTMVTPAQAASRFVALVHAKLDVQWDATDNAHLSLVGRYPTTPASPYFGSEDDKAWQLTVSNCNFKLSSSDANLTAEDKRYKERFEAGAANADNPTHDELTFMGKAEVVGQVKGATDTPVACDTSHIYWVTILSYSTVPGTILVELMVMDDYHMQGAEERVIVFKPEVFAAARTGAAAQADSITHAVARALHK